MLNAIRPTTAQLPTLFGGHGVGRSLKRQRSSIVGCAASRRCSAIQSCVAPVCGLTRHRVETVDARRAAGTRRSGRRLRGISATVPWRPVAAQPLHLAATARLPSYLLERHLAGHGGPSVRSSPAAPGGGRPERAAAVRLAEGKASPPPWCRHQRRHPGAKGEHHSAHTANLRSPSTRRISQGRTASRRWHQPSRASRRRWPGRGRQHQQQRPVAPGPLG